DAMMLADPIQHREQLLEEVPTAEIIYDHLVFDQRAMCEGPRRLRAIEPGPADKSPGDRAVAEKIDAQGRAQGGERLLRPAVEHRILDLQGLQRHAGRDQGFDMRRVEIRAAKERDLARTLQLGEPERGLDTAGHGVIPPMKLHKIEALDAEAAQ